MLCGRHSIDWNLVALAAVYIRSFPFTTKRPEMSASYIDNAAFMRERDAHKKMSLPAILRETRRLFCSNPLDKIYAMLAMPQFVTVNPQWKVDYSKSKWELYFEVATRCVVDLKSLAILSFVQQVHGIVDVLPSWVPQWD